MYKKLTIVLIYYLHRFLELIIRVVKERRMRRTVGPTRSTNKGDEKYIKNFSDKT
jgi:hypothetical protein